MVERHLIVAKVLTLLSLSTCLNQYIQKSILPKHSYISCIKHLPTAGSASAEVLITTDACVKALEEEDNSSLSLTLLVNYDLPAKRVCAACTSSQLLSSCHHHDWLVADNQVAYTMHGFITIAPCALFDVRYQAVGPYAGNSLWDHMQEIHYRRIQMVCAEAAEETDSSTAIAMYFVTAGQMPQLRAVEGFLGTAHLEVMPVHVADILQQTRLASTT